MVDRVWSSKSENKPFTPAKSRKSSSASTEFDEEYREHLEGKYLGNGLEIRPPSGTNHQQPGSHLSIDTRLSELSLADNDCKVHSHSTSGTSRKYNQYKVLEEKSNCYITSPFKQGYQVQHKGHATVVDPSIHLKKVTKESIAKVRQQFRRPRPPPDSSIYTPRLRKAKLKTTGRPISGTGPSIKQCQGIHGGGPVKRRPTPLVGYYNCDRSYSTRSPSIRPGSPTELHRPESSVHCTSRAPSDVDDSLSDEIVDTTYSNNGTESWSGHTLDGDQANDLIDDPEEDQGDLEGSSATDCRENYGIGVSKSLLKDQEDLKHSGVENQLGDVKHEQVTHKHLTNELTNDTGSDAEDKETLNKSLSFENHNGACKPFSDVNGKADHDDDDDDENHKKTLLSSYNCHNSNKSMTQAWGLNKEGSGKNEIHNSYEMKNETYQNENREELGNDRKVISYIQHTKLSNSFEKIDSIGKSNLISEQSYNEGMVHIVDSMSSCVSPLMTIHLRGRLENVEDDKPALPVNEEPCESSADIYNVDYQIQYNIEDHGDCLDSDRIPSDVIWENLDQLNLSMNASSYPSKDRLNSSHTRKVQSAGQQRKTKSRAPNSIDSKPPRNIRRSRVSSGKSRKTKTKRSEPVDKAELLRKYLADESSKFSADLPGYFTEQFHIIQEAQKEKNRGTSEENTFKALVKYKEKKEVKDRDDCSSEDVAEVKESTSLYSVEIEDPSSSGVFFTMESTSTCELESLSEQTDDTLGLGSDAREFSDDTGFETMPGASGTQSTEKCMDNNTRHEGKIQAKFVKHEDLEVVAKAKHLTDPRATNSHYKCCPYEPLNFSINARPPVGYLFYFAYGVDMNAKRMSLYLRREYKRLWGVLFGFKLCFNKKGSSDEAGGFANVEFSPGSSVEGCVYTMTDGDLSMLDNCMGFPKHYCRVVLPIWMCNCHEPDQHGVAQYCVPAILYVAEQQWVEHEHTDNLDCTYSVNQCLKASDILTPNYINYLNQLIPT